MLGHSDRVRKYRMPKTTPAAKRMGKLGRLRCTMANRADVRINAGTARIAVASRFNRTPRKNHSSSGEEMRLRNGNAQSGTLVWTGGNNPARGQLRTAIATPTPNATAI